MAWCAAAAAFQFFRSALRLQWRCEEIDRRAGGCFGRDRINRAYCLGLKLVFLPGTDASSSHHSQSSEGTPLRCAAAALLRLERRGPDKLVATARGRACGQ